jgi:toxin-antitoxin system PIN domain toxin
MALTFDAHPAHGAALGAIARASRNRQACFCRSTQQSFLRLASTPAILRAYGAEAMTNADALRAFDDLMASPIVGYLEEPKGISDIWPQIASRSSASPKVWMDAYLAAFSIAGELTMVTTDKAFRSFEKAGLHLVLL